MGKKQFCFFQTAETGNRTPDSGVKGSGANHYPRAPAQLFDSPGVPRLANKAALADYLSNHIQIPAKINIKSTLRTRWWIPITVKDMTYQRRGQTNSVDVHCERSTAFTVKKDIFLSNKKSKQLFI